MLFTAIDRFKDELTERGVTDVRLSSQTELCIHRYDGRSIRYCFKPEQNALIRQETGKTVGVILDGVASFAVEFVDETGPLRYILMLQTREQVRGFIHVKRNTEAANERAVS